MKTVKKEVKTGGKVIGTVDVPQYESTAIAAKELGEEAALSKLNRQVASDFMNEYRAAQTRDVSPINKLQKLAKVNPELQAKIDALVTKYGVETGSGAESGSAKATGGAGAGGGKSTR